MNYKRDLNASCNTQVTYTNPRQPGIRVLSEEDAYPTVNFPVMQPNINITEEDLATAKSNIKQFYYPVSIDTATPNHATSTNPVGVLDKQVPAYQVVEGMSTGSNTLVTIINFVLVALLLVIIGYLLWCIFVGHDKTVIGVQVFKEGVVVTGARGSTEVSGEYNVGLP